MTEFQIDKANELRQKIREYEDFLLENSISLKHHKKHRVGLFKITRITRFSIFAFNINLKHVDYEAQISVDLMNKFYTVIEDELLSLKEELARL